ncbi:MAG: sugar ABC transporter permease, partial [Pusillimonas sp.]
MSAAAVTASSARAAEQRISSADTQLGRWMLAPAIIYITLLVGFPFLLSMYYSVSDATVGNTTLHFVGLEN